MSTPTKSTLLACLTAQASAGGLPGYNIKFPLIEPDRADSFFPIKDLKDAAIKNGENFDEKQFFDGEKLAEVPRFTNLAHEEFRQLVLDGQPFVIDDCGKNMPMYEDQWTCKDFADRWPSGEMKAEYSADGSGRQVMGDPAWYSQKRETMDMEGSEQNLTINDHNRSQNQFFCSNFD